MEVPQFSGAPSKGLLLGPCLRNEREEEEGGGGSATEVAPKNDPALPRGKHHQESYSTTAQ